MTICAEKEKHGPPAPTKYFLQPTTTAPTCCHLESDTHTPLPIPPFLLAQNLQIVPTDNIRKSWMMTIVVISS